MKEITLSFTPAELRELAKQLYMASYFLTSNDYENQKMVDDIMTRVCATGFMEAQETGGFRHGGPTETAFTISHDMDRECQPLIELYSGYCIEEDVPYELADRDFKEQYGYHEPQEILTTPYLLNSLKELQNKYIQEFETYGVTHLRLEE